MRSHVNLLGLLQLAWGGMALLLSVVNLFVLPFGTMLAIYTYWVLLHDEARALFEHGTSAH